MTFYQFCTGETPLNVYAFVFSPLQVKPGGFLLFVGEISVAMEHWISPSMWVRRDPLSQDRESSCFLGIITASIPGRDCGFLIHAQQIHHTTSASPAPTQRSCRAEEISTGSQRRTHKCAGLAKREENMFLIAFGPKLQKKDPNK